MVVAFIPVRGGSKSIPLKNIKPLCGKPLVCWSIEALEACGGVDKIVIATDSSQIEEVVLSGGYSKVSIYRRSQESASDTAPTESVMLEYISCGDVADDVTFMLVQATSPLTQSCHFEGALDSYFSGGYDSMLSCVRSYRFFWGEDGVPQNYDYMNRPRRQDFEGRLMENGALYINSVARIKSSENRLSGRIGVYEMPEYTATEIDEPDDWIILERLMRRYAPPCEWLPIKLFLSDVDGVLTDCGMYYTQSGDEAKKFNTRDGMGLQLMQKTGVKVGIITSENTKIVENRAAKLKLDYLRQGKRDGGKLSAALEICREEGISIGEVAYIGDDINCFELLSAVGFAACPADAHSKIKSIPNIKIMSAKGGEGCVRELVDYILGD